MGASSPGGLLGLSGWFDGTRTARFSGVGLGLTLMGGREWLVGMRNADAIKYC